MKSSIDTVLLIDVGTDHAMLIEPIIRSLGVNTLIAKPRVTSEEIIQKDVRGIILCGSPKTMVDDDLEYEFDDTVLECGVPVLGICAGMELMLKMFGCDLYADSYVDSRITRANVDQSCLLFDGIDQEINVYLSKNRLVEEFPRFFKSIATSKSEIVAVSSEEKQLYGMLFLPESPYTECGEFIIKNFLYKIAGCGPSYDIFHKLKMAENIVLNIKRDKKVVCLVSGGIDSTVCAVLVERLLPNEKYFVFIDNGLLRHKEENYVRKSLSFLGIHVLVYKQSHYFLNAETFETDEGSIIRYETCSLKESCRGDVKRLIIGDAFISVLKKIIKDLGLELENTIIVQGTNRLDHIESGMWPKSISTYNFKNYHNDSFKCRKLKDSDKIIEPLLSFYKDEVRQIAKKLEISSNIINRRPFPGPGLAIRILCRKRSVFDHRSDNFDVEEVTKAMVSYGSQYLLRDNGPMTIIKRELGSQELESLRRYTEDNDLTSTILPILTHNVDNYSAGDKHCVVISSNWDKIDWNALIALSKLIPKVVTSINRVLYVFGPELKHPVCRVTITHLTPQNIELIRQAQRIVDNIVEKGNRCFYLEQLTQISQFPVILIPIQFEIPPEDATPSLQHSVVLRPFITKNFAFGDAAIPSQDFPERIVLRMKNKIMRLPGISRVLFDLSSKPPVFIEWE